MDTAQLCLARHGETDWNKRSILQGWLDVPLNAKGRLQAHDLAANLADSGLSAVWSSTLVRVRETADIIAHGWGLNVVLRHTSGLALNAVLHEKPKNGDRIWVDVTKRVLTQQYNQAKNQCRITTSHAVLSPAC